MSKRVAFGLGRRCLSNLRVCIRVVVCISFFFSPTTWHMPVVYLPSRFFPVVASSFAMCLLAALLVANLIFFFPSFPSAQRYSVVVVPPPWRRREVSFLVMSKKRNGKERENGMPSSVR